MSNGGPPPFWRAFVAALATAASVLGFVLEEIEHPSEGLRIAAIGVVVAVLVLLAVWYWGFNSNKPNGG
jgi:hypothetical protein